MAIKITSIKCPDCGASLSVEEGREKLFCSYCGSKIIVTNENEYIYRHIDEAKIKEAEVNKAVELKKLEILEKKRVSAEKFKKIKIIISILMGIVGISLFIASEEIGSLAGLFVLEGIMMIWIFSDKEKDDVDFGNMIKVPAGISEYSKKSYTWIEEMFKVAGFTNVKCVPLCDLRAGLLKRPDTVESIIINGDEITSGGKKFASDSAVVIYYHSFMDK